MPDADSTRVTAVVCAAFDTDDDARVRALRAGLGHVSRRLSAPMLHRPHLTLGAAAVAVSGLPAVHSLAARVAARHAPLEAVLGHVGVFPAGVLWLAPAPSAQLTSLQADVDGSLVAAGHPRAFDTTEPARWVAHATLGTRLRPAELGEGVRLLAERWSPLRVRVSLLVTLLVGRPDEREHPLGRPAT